MKMDNVAIMIPFCRTPKECKDVIEILKSYGLVRGENKLKIILMCEIPSNVIEADHFSKYLLGEENMDVDFMFMNLNQPKNK